MPHPNKLKKKRKYGNDLSNVLQMLLLDFLICCKLMTPWKMGDILQEISRKNSVKFHTTDDKKSSIYTWN